MTWIYVNMFECARMCVLDAWNSTSVTLSHREQFVCVTPFYWNYLFLITIESKFNLFHKRSAVVI